MSDGHILNAYGSGWDAADAVAAAMRIEAILDVASNPPSEADVGVQGRALILLKPPGDTPVSHRLAADGARLATTAIASNGGHGSLAFGLSGHPSIASMVLELPLGPASFGDERMIWTTPALVERLRIVLDTVRRTADLLTAGRRTEALRHRREAGTVAKCVEAVIAGCWSERGSLTGPFASVMATTECPTPWTTASMTSGQNLGGASDPTLGLLDRTPRPSNPLLDEEGTAILASALPHAIEISWDADVRMPDGTATRRMRVSPMQVMTLITKSSVLDPMQTLRAHRVAPIPDHCIRRIGA